MPVPIARIRIVVVVLVLALAGWLGAKYLLGNGTPSRLTLYGNVDIRQVDVGFRVAGRIKSVLADEGDKVATGDILARLDDDLLTQERDQAAA